MNYTDEVKVHQKGSRFETKEVIANVQFSQADLKCLKEIIQEALSKRNLSEASRIWGKHTLLDVQASLKKQ